MVAIILAFSVMNFLGLGVAQGQPSSLYPVTVTVDDGATIEKVFLAAHTGDLAGGNWIALSGGTTITLPSLTFAYEGPDTASYTRDGTTITIESISTQGSTTYPLATHNVYSALQPITAKFWGATALQGESVDFKLLRLSSVSEIRDIAVDTFQGDLDPLRDKLSSPTWSETSALDTSGDATVNIPKQDPGAYLLAVVKEDGDDIYIYSATVVEVVDQILAVSAPSSVKQGESLNVNTGVLGAYIHGAVMIKKSAYYVEAKLKSEGTVLSTEFYLNDVLMADGAFVIDTEDLSYEDMVLLLNKLTMVFGSNQIAIGINPIIGVISLPTSSLTPGDYVLLVGVYDVLTSRIVGIYQKTVTVLTPTPPPPPPTNKPPTAKVKPVQPIVEGDSASFDASASNDPDGFIVSYSWDFGDGGTGSGVTVSHTYNVPGTYTVTVTVRDNIGATASASTTIQVKANQKPQAVAGSSRNTFVGKDVTFNGHASKDPDGSIVSYIWDFGDGSTASGPLVQHAYTVKGSYTVTLTVKDNKGATDSASLTIKVEELPAPKKGEKEEKITGEKKNVEIDAMSTIGAKLRVNTISDVNVYLVKYETRPYEDVPPPNNPGIYLDVSVSDPDAVEWPIYIEIHYTDAEVAGLDESTFAVYYYTNGAWRLCSNTGVDAVNNFVWAYLTRAEAAGSPLTIGKTPAAAQFTLSGLSVSPASVNVGASVTVQVTVKNIGDLEGSTTVDLLVNGVEEQSKTVTLAGGASTTVSFSVTKTTVGSYTVKVGDLTGSFTVVEPPTPAAFTFTGLVVSPADVAPGAEVTASVTVKNTGEQSGTYSAELKLDGATKETKTGTLAGGASTTVTFKVSSQAEGTHTVQVDTQTGSFTVTAPTVSILLSPAYIAGILMILAVAVASIYTLYKGGRLPLHSLPKSTPGAINQ